MKNFQCYIKQNSESTCEILSRQADQRSYRTLINPLVLSVNFVLSHNKYGR
jgi:hypothetical protein